jgi:serine/threonine-protein kinase
MTPGTLIAGRYSIVRLLGRGAMKEVYLADDRLAGAPVALALLRTESTADPTLAARFSREARASSVLRSPYVVRVFDVGKLADGTRYLATEPVLGRGLDQAIADGPIPPA